MPIQGFDTENFFARTAHYASQGRGRFTIGTQPLVLQESYAFNAVPPHIQARDVISRGLLAKSIEDPGVNLGTFEEFSFSGPTRKHAHSQIFGPLNVEFLLMGQTPEEARSVYLYFYTWMSRIVGPLWPTNPVDVIPTVDSNLFALEYYDQYVTTADVQMFSPWNDTPIIEFRYHNIYPQAIQGISTSWDNQDAPITFRVTFEFWYRTVHPMPSTVPRS